MNYDVIVVGAGPSGSTCARYLAKAGLNVALIDKDEFPRDKPCGGGFSYSIIKRFSYLKKQESEFLDGILRMGVIHSPNRRITLKGKVDMAVALRTKFDFALLNDAIDCGSTSYCGNRVKKLKLSKNSVEISTSNGDSFQAPILIGADGVTSFIARESGLHVKWKSDEVTACRVAEIPLERKRIQAVFGEEREYHFYVNFNREPGYGWIFPKYATINVGLGVVGTHSAGLPRKFIRYVCFLRNQGLLPEDADLSKTKGALVPTAGTIHKTYADRILLVGDSAGMVSPITGGGIAYAMRAGRIAASVVKNNFADDAFNEKSLAAYQKLWHSDFGYEIEPQLLAQKIFTSSLTDTLFEIGKRDPIIQEIVTNAMSESNNEGPDIKKLLTRTLLVCLRGGLHL